MKKLTNLRNNQDGLVAIIVTMLIMIVLTLIVTGFAQLARREQREALDRQLSTQAFYAVESGINDARRLLKTTPALVAGGNKDNCATTDSSLDSGSTFQYTCLLITQRLTSLKYQNVQTNKSTVVPINQDLASGSTNDKLTISWQNKDGSNNLYTGTGFPPATTWNSDFVGVLRIDITEADVLSTNSLTSKTYTAFLRPSSDMSVPGTTSFTTVPSEQGQVINAKCNGTGKKLCFVTIDGIRDTSKYYLRMKSIYNVADVDICGGNFSCSNNVVLTNAQAEVDVTGRAGDILKRVQVRLPVEELSGNEITTPEYALESSDSICKLISVWPGGGNAGVCP